MVGAAAQPIGTPDWQRGVVNPEKLVGKILSPNLTTTVTAPANADALWVLAGAFFTGSNLTVAGVTTGDSYPAFTVGNAYVVPIQTTVDSQYAVTLPGPVEITTWIVAQSWGSLVTALLPAQIEKSGDGIVPGQGPLLVGGTDGANARTLRTDSNGQSFTVPAAPGITTADHPPSELLMAYFNGGIPTTILAAPGAGKRYRYYGGKVWIYSTPVNGYAVQATKGGIAVTLLEATSAIQSDSQWMGPPGIPLDTNTGIVSAAVLGGGASANGHVIYTLETV